MNEDSYGLGAAELPPNIPPPKNTPPQGVILTRAGKDGWTRKYLYRAGLGDDGKPWQKSFLIKEIAPSSMALAPRSVVTREPEPYREQTPYQALAPAYEPSLAGPALPPPQAASELPIALMDTKRVETLRMEMPANSMMRPLPLKVAPQKAPMLGNSKPRLGQAFPIGGGTLPTGTPALLPQVQPPAAPEPACPVGPMTLPDGRVLNPDDPITLADLCAVMPSIAKALGVAPKAGGQSLGPVPMAGQPNGMQSIAAPTAFGQPGGGPGGGGGGFGFGGGGGGAPGTQGPAGQPGVAGAPGAQGPTGIGSGFDFVSKTDGDFTAGPGSFIPVPGTLLAFSLPADGSVMFFVQATLGCSQTQNGALGLRIDGVDYPVNKRLLHTVVGGDEFYAPSSYMFPISLLAGAHTVEVVLRGLAAGSECAASGLGLSQTVSASAEAPLILIAQHSVAGSPAPTAATIVIDGINKTDGNFTSATVVPVPGTLINFTVTAAGNAFFAISGSLTAVAVASVTNAILGVRIDGIDYSLAETSEQQGAGGDRMFVMQLAGSMTIPLAVGPHQAQLIFGNIGGVNQFALVAVPLHPATLSIIHS